MCQDAPLSVSARRTIYHLGLCINKHWFPGGPCSVGTAGARPSMSGAGEIFLIGFAEFFKCTRLSLRESRRVKTTFLHYDAAEITHSKREK